MPDGLFTGGQPPKEEEQKAPAKETKAAEPAKEQAKQEITKSSISLVIPNRGKAEELDARIAEVVSAKHIEGFQKAYLVAQAFAELEKSLTSEYMKPIMQLQGSKLGFRTDKDREGGYPEPIVKRCLIEAVLKGLQPFDNQFNIIAGNMYITKEGLGYLLRKQEGLKYQITPQLPRLNNSNPTAATSAAIVMVIVWSLNGGKTTTHPMEIPIRINSGMGMDAIIGKATRKARAWLYNTINDCDEADGDVLDTDYELVASATNKAAAGRFANFAQNEQQPNQ